jgi:hypothetical protein
LEPKKVSSMVEKMVEMDDLLAGWKEFQKVHKMAAK